MLSLGCLWVFIDIPGHLGLSTLNVLICAEMYSYKFTFNSLQLPCYWPNECQQVVLNLKANSFADKGVEKFSHACVLLCY
jgi:hypothetical protein